MPASQVGIERENADRLNGDPAPRFAIVVFVDHADCRWLQVLRAGFRHCFVVLRDGTVWLACDSLKDRIELTVLTVPERFDLPGFYAMRGHRVLSGATRTDLPRPEVSIAPLTCVTIAKRLLGVRAPRIFTPWQLYRHLREIGFEPSTGSTRSSDGATKDSVKRGLTAER
jgi:hypothetical protein